MEDKMAAVAFGALRIKGDWTFFGRHPTCWEPVVVHVLKPPVGLYPLPDNSPILLYVDFPTSPSDIVL